MDDTSSERAPFDRIAYFRLTKYSVEARKDPVKASVFKNHFQMCPVKLEILAYSGDNAVPVEATHLSIIDSTTGQDLHLFKPSDGLWPLDKWHWAREPRHQGTIVYNESFIDRVHAASTDARVAIEMPSLPLKIRNGRYESLTMPGMTWDKEWFDGMVDYHRAHRDAPDSLFSGESLAVRLADFKQREDRLRAQNESMHADRPSRKARPDAAQTFIFYVSCPGGTTSNQVTIAAGVRTNIGDQAYKSTTNHLDVTDDDGFGDGSGRFNSRIEINAVTMPFLGLPAYGTKKVGSNTTLADTSTNISDDIARSYWHHLNVSFDNIPIPIWKAGDTFSAGFWSSGGGLLRHSGKDSGTEWSTVMIQEPNRHTVYHDTAADQLVSVSGGRTCSMEYLVERYAQGTYSGQTSAALFQVMGNHHQQFRDADGHNVDEALHQSKIFALVDVHGNSHRIKVSIDVMNYIDIHDP